jgi:hypothetical protein
VTDVAEKLARKAEHGTPTRQMRLTLAHIGVWSSTKLALVLSVCLNIVTVAMIFGVAQLLGDADVVRTLTSSYRELTSKTLDLSVILDGSTVAGFAAAVVVLNTVLVTGFGAIYAALFNLSVRATGGTLTGFRNP